MALPTNFAPVAGADLTDSTFVAGQKKALETAMANLTAFQNTRGRAKDIHLFFQHCGFQIPKLTDTKLCHPLQTEAISEPVNIGDIFYRVKTGYSSETGDYIFELAQTNKDGKHPKVIGSVVVGKRNGDYRVGIGPKKYTDIDPQDGNLHVSNEIERGSIKDLALLTFDPTHTALYHRMQAASDTAFGRQKVGVGPSFLPSIVQGGYPENWESEVARRKRGKGGVSSLHGTKPAPAATAPAPAGT